LARLEGRVAVVTGGGRGIGRAVALRLAADGADVLTVVGKNLDQAQAVSKEIMDLGLKSSSHQVDVSNADAVDKMFTQIIEGYGKVDILINNAGIRRDRAFHNMDPATWQEVIETNLTGAFNLCRLGVEQPGGPTAGDPAGGVRLGRRGENLAQDPGLRLAAGQDHDPGGAVDEGEGEGHAVLPVRGTGGGGPGPLFLEGCRAGEQRGRVPVLPHA